MSKVVKEQVTYRVNGFSCANCAGKFERNVKALPEVTDAKVNFGAAKIVVYGKATIDELEAAGAFENLSVTVDGAKNNRAQITKHKKMYLTRQHIPLAISLFFIMLGYVVEQLSSVPLFISSLFFATAIIVGGYPLFMVGIRNLLRAEFDMKTLMTVAIIGAALIGQWAEGAIVVILFAISEALERFSMDRARQSIRTLMDIAPNEALIERDGQEWLLPVEEIVIGDLMIVKPGQKIAMDGVIVKGQGAVNQAAITGESMPLEKTMGDEVFAGTLNEDGLLTISVTKLVEDTTIANIIHLVEEAQGERAPAQAFVDKFAKYYTPVIMLIAVLVAVVPPLFGASWDIWVYQGLAVLVVGCPCALVISTPVSIVSAIGNAANNGVLVKGGIHLEALGNVQAVAFDKTGTLTKGIPTVTDFQSYTQDMKDDEIWSIVAALESRSGHPLALAILQKAKKLHVKDIRHTVTNFSSSVGKGIQGVIDGNMYTIGNIKLVAEKKIELTMQQHAYIQKLQQEGKTTMLICQRDAIIAVIAVADQIRTSSKRVIQQLQTMGIDKTVMLTGDNLGTAKAVGQTLGIDDIQAELLPQDKLTVIEQLKATHHAVAMVGDGVNDAPALAASTVGIAMGGSGTDTALETADIAFMNDDIKKIPFAIRLSRKTLTIIKQNIIFAIAIKCVALLLVIPGWLTLWIAIFSDMGATLLVTLNGLRLLRISAQD